LCAGCNPDPTSILLQVDLSLNAAPSTFLVSVFAPDRPLAEKRSAPGAQQLRITGLPDVAEEIRIVLYDSKGPIGASRVNTKPNQEVVAHVVLYDAGTTADSDGDGIPDSVDNCPDVPNPHQEQVCRTVGLDLGTGPCGHLFCDDFESDTADSTGVKGGGSTLWFPFGTVDGTLEIDPTQGARGSQHSLKITLNRSPVQDLGGPDRPGIWLDLASVPNIQQIRQGPMFVRMYVKLSAAPGQLGGISLMRTWLGGDENDNIEVDILSGGGVGWYLRANDLLNPNGMDADPLNIDWVNQWVCVEWTNILMQGNYLGQITANQNTMKATAMGTTTVPAFGGLNIGPDVIFDNLALNSVTMWIDEIAVDNNLPPGCN
jgi:hypothetical protein